MRMTRPMSSRRRSAGAAPAHPLLRCHDDFGWVFAGDDVEAVGFAPGAHHRFLTRFYNGPFEGSFARTAPFQENARTGDARVSGMAASLTGAVCLRR
jgi:amylosucrase/maltose alpha-D-glucosyltransferase/alpha-amylase